jgi:hypothetical protein
LANSIAGENDGEPPVDWQSQSRFYIVGGAAGGNTSYSGPNCARKHNSFPAAGGCETFRELRPRLHSPSVDGKIGRAVAYCAFLAALTLAQRALAAAAIFLRAARLMVRFL